MSSNVYIGTTGITDVRIGSTEVTAAYVGNSKIWPIQPPVVGNIYVLIDLADVTPASVQVMATSDLSWCSNISCLVYDYTSGAVYAYTGNTFDLPYIPNSASIELYITTNTSTLPDGIGFSPSMGQAGAGTIYFSGITDIGRNFFTETNGSSFNINNTSIQTLESFWASGMSFGTITLSGLSAWNIRLLSECWVWGALNIPTGVTAIPSHFLYKTYIRSLTIPANITSMGANCFEECISLTELVFQSTTPPTFGDYTFSNIGSQSGVVKYPSGSSYGNLLTAINAQSGGQWVGQGV